MAAIYSLFIINKSGGLIFYKDYGSSGRMDTNDSLRLASLWHSMHAISQQLSPVVPALNSLKPTTSISIASSHLQVMLLLEYK
ncbi:Sybindin-like protein [Macleaya cordata]|uniref:Trafficking protein particle complex subunit n=1 Tax=Macleaya cordata TaxID=56857 RepID=A0A200PMY2_MACCD|nr:Sybindin-like protein [Macleaya cordata]